MPRKLPWLTGASGSDVSTAKSKGAIATTAKALVTPRATKRKMGIETEEEENVKAHQTSPYKKRSEREDKRASRSPSTSTPPPGPPPEEFMRPGYAADDRYRMVEDEFYTIAQKYTSHLHHAEYRRLVKESKNKPFDGVLAIKRPVDGKTLMSYEIKKKKEANEQALRAGKAVKGLTGAGATDNEVEAGDEPWMGTNLQGLMTGERTKSRALVGLEGVRSKTKAANGFGSPKKDKNMRSLFLGVRSATNAASGKIHDDEVETEDYVSDDLGAGPSTRSAILVRHSSSPQTDAKTAKVREIFASQTSKNSAAEPPRRPTATMTAEQAHPLKNKVPANSRAPRASSSKALSNHRRSALDVIDDFDADYDLPPASSATSSAFTKKRGY